MLEVKANENQWVWDTHSTSSMKSTEGIQVFQLGTVCAEGVVLEALEGVGELGTLCFNLP